ncbi:DUF4839 domain-containing protein [Sinomonas susongensis]|uniref:DUF4839 domain-containing protein n=1 Tax=Sinomonas susongensis TaxID=1324851 RepID=UPI0011093F44|nr:DUF4839 domain-containing protein [Sinomonas susongensis]
MADEQPKYEVKNVQTIRGAEARTRAKWEKEGWEFVSQNQELLRTKMEFRRVKAKLPLKLIGAGAALLLVLAIVGITVDATHGGGATAAPTASASDVAVVASEKATSAPSTSATSATPAVQNLTVQNNADLAALLAAPEPSEKQQEDFAAKYQGRTIEFDGNITLLSSHDGDKYVYDVLITAGNYSADHQVGPAFQYNGVSMVQMHLTGTQPSVAQRDNVHLVADVGDYNSSGNLFYLSPVSTAVR